MKQNLSCSDIQKLLPRFLQGKLSRRKSEQISAHLKVCPACQARKAAIDDELRKLEYDQPPERRISGNAVALLVVAICLLLPLSFIVYTVCGGRDHHDSDFLIPYDTVSSIKYIRYTAPDGTVYLCEMDRLSDDARGEIKGDLDYLEGEKSEPESTAAKYQFELISAWQTTVLKTFDNDQLLIDDVCYSLDYRSVAFGNKLARACMEYGVSDVPQLMLYVRRVEAKQLDSVWSLKQETEQQLKIPIAVTDDADLPVVTKSDPSFDWHFDLTPDSVQVYIWKTDKDGHAVGDPELLSAFTADNLSYTIDFPDEQNYIVELCADWKLPGGTGGSAAYAFRFCMDAPDEHITVSDTEYDADADALQEPATVNEAEYDSDEAG